MNRTAAMEVDRQYLRPATIPLVHVQDRAPTYRLAWYIGGRETGPRKSWLRPHSRIGRSAPRWRSLPPPSPPSPWVKRRAASVRLGVASEPSSNMFQRP